MKRTRKLNELEYISGPVLYWMNRDQRLHDNWAVIFAQQLAKEHKTSFGIVFNLDPTFLGGRSRHFNFKVKGLEEIEKECKKKNIPFTIVLAKETEKEILDIIKKQKVGALITDFSPLKIAQKWQKNILKKIDIPMYEVDAHNIVPCWVASKKQEFAAYTIRPKISKLLPHFLEEFPKVKKQSSHEFKNSDFKIHWKQIWELDPGNDIEIKMIKPGMKEAKKMLKEFISQKLNDYNEKRNDPNEDVQSNLSPYLHYGHICAQTVALEIQSCKARKENKEAFLEELIIRKELSDNFCYYNQNYDSIKAFPAWAKETLKDHVKDKREYIYTKKQFEKAQTHDELWNAAQNEMVHTGKMHGYMRMYWAKKIFEWTQNPKTAMKIAIYLNDTYELDGRDPNGYAGIAWSIGGVHDRAWFERKVFGKIRYMNRKGCERKFDTEKYIEKIKGYAMVKKTKN